jgi:hypothetical protein
LERGDTVLSDDVTNDAICICGREILHFEVDVSEIHDVANFTLKRFAVSIAACDHG